jgi:maleylpyruvate isomerase
VLEDNDRMGLDPDVGFEPAVLLERITAATERLLVGAAALTDADMREPSLLPNWSRGHVLTHLARNADGGARLLGWARTGTPAAEYPSLRERDAQIEAGAGRSAADLIADLRASAAAFAAQYALMPAAGWQNTVQWAAGQRHRAARIADARLCEVLIHHLDLRVGLTPDDWPADFVTYELKTVTSAFDIRGESPSLRLHATDTGIRYEICAADDDAAVVHGGQASLLAWLMGRSPGDDLITDDGSAPPTPPFLY